MKNKNILNNVKNAFLDSQRVLILNMTNYSTNYQNVEDEVNALTPENSIKDKRFLRLGGGTKNMSSSDRKSNFLSSDRKLNFLLSDRKNLSSKSRT